MSAGGQLFVSRYDVFCAVLHPFRFHLRDDGRKLIGVPFYFGSRKPQEILPFRCAGNPDGGCGVVPFILPYVETGMNHSYRSAMNHLEIQGPFLLWQVEGRNFNLNEAIMIFVLENGYGLYSGFS